MDITRSISRILWIKEKINNPKLTPDKIVIKVGEKINRIPATVASYACLSDNAIVRSEAFIARNILYSRIYEIKDHWYDIKRKSPNISKILIFEKISELKGISLSTVIMHSRYAEDLNIQKAAESCQGMVLHSIHEITKIWKKIISNNRNFNLALICKLIGRRKGLKSSTVASYAAFSKDKEIRNQGRKAFNMLMDIKHLLTYRWRKMINRDHTLNGEDIILKLSKVTNLSPITIANYLSQSRCKEIRKESRKTAMKIIARMHKIEDRWYYYKNKQSISEKMEIIVLISKELNLKPSSVLSYAKYVDDIEISREANSIWLTKK